MSKPIAVLISDIHFNLVTLPFASAALKSAIVRAEQLQVPLIIAGDLQDHKAIIRGEVANRLISILGTAGTDIYILVGNHDLINEKGSENALNYLEPYAEIINYYCSINLGDQEVVLIPYENDASRIPLIMEWTKPSTNPRSLQPGNPRLAIMHQGFLGAQMGDYVQDKTSVSPEIVKDLRVFSGHYHRHQTIGTVTYIGSPYTITFGEANDGPKGFLILNSDGSFQQEILDLRRHEILEFTVNEHGAIREYVPRLSGDTLLWVKIKGPKSLLDQIDKRALGTNIIGHSNYKLDLLFENADPAELKRIEDKSDIDILDELIDNIADSDERKKLLKELYRETLSS